LTEYERVFQRVFQFADVAGEMPGRQQGSGGAGYPRHLFLKPPVELRNEVFTQVRNVPAPLPQGRQCDVDHVQSIVQILAEHSPGHEFGQVPVGRRQDAHIGFHADRAAEGLIPPLLQNPQQLGLHGNGHVPDFVQQENAAPGQGKFAGLIPLRIRERTGPVTEQLAFQQRLRQGTAVHRDERPAAPAAFRVNGPCNPLLARSAFAGDQNRRVGFRQGRQHLKNALHGRTATRQIGESMQGVIIPLQRRDERRIAGLLLALRRDIRQLEQQGVFPRR